MGLVASFLLFLFFNDTATTEIYTLSLHDALPISTSVAAFVDGFARGPVDAAVEILGMTDFARTFGGPSVMPRIDRKSTRLNSSHSQISYAVFCLKKTYA